MDNQIRKNWNQVVDRALVSGVPERQIIQVKCIEISNKVRESVKQFGRKPHFLVNIILLAITTLELLITQILNLSYQSLDREKEEPRKAVEHIEEELVREELLKQTIPDQPQKSLLATKYSRLVEIYNILEKKLCYFSERRTVEWIGKGN